MWNESNLSRFGTTMLPATDHKRLFVVKVAGTAKKIFASFVTLEKWVLLTLHHFIEQLLVSIH